MLYGYGELLLLLCLCRSMGVPKGSDICSKTFDICNGKGQTLLEVSTSISSTNNTTIALLEARPASIMGHECTN